jgi:hypothetical protein
MFGLVEICILATAAVLLLLRALPYFRPYRPLFGGGGVLALITALFPRTSNPLGQFLFGTTGEGLRLPRELFGIVWWILGAWLFKNLLDLVLRRTFFPDNDEPHARRLLRIWPLGSSMSSPLSAARRPKVGKMPGLPEARSIRQLHRDACSHAWLSRFSSLRPGPQAG